MLSEKDLQSYIQLNYSNSILDQAHQQKNQKNYRSFHLVIDLFYLIKNLPKIATVIVGNYYFFIQNLEKTVHQILTDSNYPLPVYGYKISMYFQNCTIPRHNLKSIEFLTASLNQSDGILVYLKDAEIISIKQSELYIQSWTQIWQYICNCKSLLNQNNGKIYKRQISQSLLDIINKGCTTSLKQYCKGTQPIQCSDCLMNLHFYDRVQFIYEQCSQIEVSIEMKRNFFEKQRQMFNNKNFKIYVDKHNSNKFKVGDIFNACCFFKSSVELTKSSAINPKMFAQIKSLIYLVCSYPQNFYLTPSNNIFFSKLRHVTLQQRYITKMNSIHDMVYNYKNFTQSINQIRYPYLGPNSLTALKLITLSSIFSHQANREKLNLLIITDQVSMMSKILQINDLSIIKFPSLYDEKTISNFFNSCQNSVVLISNPDKKQFTLINKILRKQIYSNINFVLWIVCEPEQNLKKKIQINQIEIILDLTVQKNLNVCQSVYVSMIDDFLESFMQQNEEDQLVATIVKKYNKHMPYEDDIIMQTPVKNFGKNQKLKQERLANDLLKRYFLKARQYKTTKARTVQTLTLIAQSFTQFRYFIQNKCFHENDQSKESNDFHLSVLDVILAIFIDEQTSRNKYSSSNTFFADQVSKIMLNENTCNVSIWDYEVENDFVQQTKRFIPRDQLVGMVLTKMFDLVYGQQ